jgi:HK97 family phage major capsid protein
MSLRKQIDSLQAKRNKHLDAMTTLSELAAGEDRNFTEDEQKAFDKDKGEVDDIDAQMTRLNAAEQMLAKRALPAPSPLEPTPGLVARPFKAFPGQGFTRYIAALARSKGNLMQALEISKAWDHETPEVGAVLRAAVAVGTTTDPVWAAPLVNYQIMNAEFIELLRPETILGNLNGYRSVPFNVKIPRQTAGATSNWVGEGLSKPVSRLTFDQVTIPFAKIAVICVITQELARFSQPSAEMLVRDDLVSSIAQFIDQQFIDGSVAAVAGLKPGSINNTSPNIPSSGYNVQHVTADLAAAMLAMTAAGIQLRRPVWIMSPNAAMYLATLRTAQDIFAFPGMGVGGAPSAAQGQTGATLMGIPVVVSGNIPTVAGPPIQSSITLLEQSELMVADDGQTMIDTSTEASLQSDSAPATPPTPLISLWQQNMLGIKAERFIFWLMRRTAAVQEITGFPSATA